jgi:protein-tyrosine phosphatase
MTRPLPTPIHDILVICSGNICRSPMAAAALRAELATAGVRGARVHSAGTVATPGALASPEAVETAEEHGLDISYHRATPLTRELVRRADLIVVMEKSHADAVRALDFNAGYKTFLLSEWADDAQRGGDIPDPYGMPYAFFEVVFRRQNEAVKRLAAQIGQNSGPKKPD